MGEREGSQSEGWRSWQGGFRRGRERQRWLKGRKREKPVGGKEWHYRCAL